MSPLRTRLDGPTITILVGIAVALASVAVLLIGPK